MRPDDKTVMIVTGVVVALFILVITFSTPVSTAPDCQKYLDAAAASAQKYKIGNAAVQAGAFETMAWVAIYNACRGR